MNFMCRMVVLNDDSNSLTSDLIATLVLEIKVNHLITNTCLQRCIRKTSSLLKLWLNVICVTHPDSVGILLLHHYCGPFFLYFFLFWFFIIFLFKSPLPPFTFKRLRSPWACIMSPLQWTASTNILPPLFSCIYCFYQTLLLS